MTKKKSTSKKEKTKISKVKKETTRTIVFKIYCPEANEVHLSGDFNDWDEHSLPMIKREDGVWELVQELKPGEYQYKYLVDGNWEIDNQQEQVTNQYGTMNNIIRIE